MFTKFYIFICAALLVNFITIRTKHRFQAAAILLSCIALVTNLDDSFAALSYDTTFHKNASNGSPFVLSRCYRRRLHSVPVVPLFGLFCVVSAILC